MAGETHAGVYFIKAAIEHAGTTQADKVIAAVEKEPLAWETPEGWKVMHPVDHTIDLHLNTQFSIMMLYCVLYYSLILYT